MLSTPPAMADDSGSVPLTAPWVLQSTQATDATGEQISRVGYTPQGWMPAVVPGTVLTSYVKDGKYPEPYYDVNNKIEKGLIPDASVPGSVFTHPHWYRTTFTVPHAEAGRTLWLDLNGINYKADIYLNGQSVGKMAGMFKRGMFNVTGIAAPGPNALAVKIYPLDVPGTPHDHGCGGDGKIGQNAATMYATIGWDFTLIDGVRDRNMGIYRAVSVTSTGPVRLRDPFMRTDRLPSKASDTADLSFQATCINATDQAVSGTLKLAIQGGAVVSEPVTLAPNETREITLTPDTHPGLRVAHPRLWWPVFQGRPNLYGLHLSFVTSEGGVSDTLDTHFGIRTVTPDMSFHGQIAFLVNGRRVFIQGGNWVQDAMLRATRKDYEVRLSQIAQAGVNMLRCWSASAPESDDFYDLCDRLGIMVWTESGAAAQVWGPTDAKTATGQLGRHHPARPGPPQPGVLLRRATRAGPWPGRTRSRRSTTRRWATRTVPRQNGQRGDPYRFLGVNTLYDYTAIDEYGAGPLGPFGGFCNETGNPVLPPAEVLRQQIAPRNLWPTTGNPGFDEAIDYHDGGGFHLVRSLINTGCAKYGGFAAPDPAGRVGVDNYAFKGQLLGAMQYRAFSEIWKRNKWDEAHKRYDTGYMMWTINNPNPMTASRLANHSGEPNAALFYFAHGNKPLHAQYDYFYNDVSVINDHPTPFQRLTVTAEVRNLDWSLRWTGSKTVAVDADTSLNDVLAVPAKDTAGFDDVHFVVVALHDAAGASAGPGDLLALQERPEGRGRRPVHRPQRDADGAARREDGSAGRRQPPDPHRDADEPDGAAGLLHAPEGLPGEVADAGAALHLLRRLLLAAAARDQDGHADL